MKLMTMVMMIIFSLTSLAATDYIEYEVNSQDDQQSVFLGEDETPALGDSIGYNVIYPTFDSKQSTSRKTAGQDDDQTVLGDSIQY